MNLEDVPLSERSQTQNDKCWTSPRTALSQKRKVEWWSSGVGVENRELFNGGQSFRLAR